MKKPSVLISVLNWNNATDTIKCVDSLLATISQDLVSVEIRVIDNGSNQADYLKLQQSNEERKFNITRLNENVGFTGGHNIAIAQAIENKFDYVWLLNNDATVEMGCLEKLVDEMEADIALGAVSPVIAPKGGGHPHAAWGGMHKWETRQTIWFHSEREAMETHRLRPDEIFVAGTAILLRTKAMQQIGELDDRLFAYYDDSDLGVRLAKRNWRSKVVFNASVEHGWRSSEQLPNYFFYLFFRNEMIFLHTHTPPQFRRFLWLKLIDQALYNANRLSLRGLQSQSDAALLGIWDFIFSNYGRPNLSRKVPALMRLLRGASIFVYKSKLAGLEEAPEVSTAK